MGKPWPWTDEEIAIIREYWLAGENDRQLSARIDRSAKQINSKRQQLKLTAEYYPDRPNPGHHRSSRAYTPDDDHAILTRVHNGEPAKSIAQSYGISTKAMTNKIDRLIASGRGIKREMTGRGCLRCGTWFFSSQPKSVNRRCTACQTELNETGASLMTVC